MGSDNEYIGTTEAAKVLQMTSRTIKNMREIWKSAA